MIPSFQHTPQAHCESGVTVHLLRQAGLTLSEPMVFGIGSGLFFGHLPFVKVNGVPGTTYRIYPGQIFRNLCKRLDITYATERFRTPQQGLRRLNQNLDAGIPTGCQVSVFYLPFLPEVFRFHFNAHNLVVVNRQETQYQVSDPVMPEMSWIHEEDLQKARFAKGFPEPAGRMYYIRSIPASPDIKRAVVKGIRQTVFFMHSPPIPWFGVNAIRYLSKKIASYPSQLDARRATLYLGNIIRMQEEIGTGGAGFRFLYAAFLQEAASLPGLASLRDLSGEMTLIGDRWRNFAYEAARICKARTGLTADYAALSDGLLQIYESEKKFYLKLSKAVTHKM